MRKQIIFTLSILLFLIIGTIFTILYGKGYRISFKQNIPQINKTGLLVVDSSPNGAQVLIDNHITTATNSTINLPPGIYDIKIQKEGYFPWQKKLKIEAEVVTKAETVLFPVAPRLESIAATPVINPLIDPSGTKIAFQIASDAATKKNGIYILTMNTNTISVSILTLQSASTQIADDTTAPFSQASLKWSLDGTQILAQISDSTQISTYLLRTDRLNETPQDVTAILQNIEDNWRLQKEQKERNMLAGIKEDKRGLIERNFSVLSWSQDETKILYEASVSAQLPLITKPRRLGIDSLAEERQITKGRIYVYDTKEDINTKIPISLPESNSQISWLPDSNHLLYINDKKIVIMDTDGSNWITVYAGPFIDTFAVPWPDSSKIVILTNLSNPNTSPTLYTIGLK